jgi:hypothetical protein
MSAPHEAAPRDGSWTRRYLAGLDSAARGNAQAFGFSILVTVTFGAVSARHGSPGPGQLMGFALCAVAAFAGLNVVVALVLDRAPSSATPQRILLLATATDFLAVGSGVGAAEWIAAECPGTTAWLLAPPAASLLYTLVQAVEFAVGRATSEKADKDAGADDSPERVG